MNTASGQLDVELALAAGIAVVLLLVLIGWLAQRLLSLTRFGRLILICVAFVFLTLSVIIALMTVAAVVLMSADNGWCSLVILGAGLAFAWLYALVARGFVRRGRRMVLFLRRFRFAPATNTVSSVAKGWVGASWRVVTLDDDSVAPIGAARKNRFLSLSAVLLGLVAAPATTTYYLSSASPSAAVVSSTVVGAFLGIILGIAGLVFGMSAWRARRQSRIVVDKPRHVDRRARRVAQRSHRVMAPRLVVCRVVTPLWQAMVSALMARADAVVVDLSQPSESVVWEVDLLRRNPGRRRVLICHKDLAAPLVDRDQSAFGSAHDQVVSLVDGHEVLLYGTTDAEVRAFAVALQRRLD